MCLTYHMISHPGHTWLTQHLVTIKASSKPSLIEKQIFLALLLACLSQKPHTTQLDWKTLKHNILWWEWQKFSCCAVLGRRQVYRLYWLNPRQNSHNLIKEGEPVKAESRHALFAPRLRKNTAIPTVLVPQHTTCDACDMRQACDRQRCQADSSTYLY